MSACQQGTPTKEGGANPLENRGVAVAPLRPDPVTTITIRCLWGFLVGPMSGEAFAQSVLCLFFITCIALLELEVPNLRHPLNLLHMYADTATSQLILYTLLLLVIIATPLPRRAFNATRGDGRTFDPKNKGKSNTEGDNESSFSSRLSFWDCAEGRRLNAKALFVLAALIASTAVECIARADLVDLDGTNQERERGKPNIWRALISFLRYANPFSPVATAACAYGMAIVAGLLGY